MRILKEAPRDAKEAYIDIMGRYTYDIKREGLLHSILFSFYIFLIFLIFFLSLVVVPMVAPVVATPVKRETISPEPPPVKKQKVEVECITIDSDSDSDDGSSNRPPPPARAGSKQPQRSESSNYTNSSHLSPNSDCMLSSHI